MLTHSLNEYFQIFFKKRKSFLGSLLYFLNISCKDRVERWPPSDEYSLFTALAEGLSSSSVPEPKLSGSRFPIGPLGVRCVSPPPYTHHLKNYFFKVLMRNKIQIDLVNTKRKKNNKEGRSDLGLLLHSAAHA